MGNHRFLGAATSWDQVHMIVGDAHPFVRRPQTAERLPGEELKALIQRCGFRQIDAAWLCGVHVRQVKAWCRGEYPVPQYAALLLRAHAEGLLPVAWLTAQIERPML